MRDIIRTTELRDEIEEQMRKHTFCGYSFEELLIFAEACRKAGIEEHDLKVFCKNVESAFNYVYSKMVEELDRNYKKGEKVCAK